MFLNYENLLNSLEIVAMETGINFGNKKKPKKTGSSNIMSFNSYH